MRGLSNRSGSVVAHLKVVTRKGKELTLEAEAGRSVMRIIRDGGVDELAAMCGGNCSCATCHVHVDRADFGRLPPIGEDESDLLEGSAYRTQTSRLSCQIEFTEALDGLRVSIAPED